jgi:hypothetical protein
MLHPLREQFNARFKPSDYRGLLARMNAVTRSVVPFRISETPCFFPDALLDEMSAIGKTLTHQLVDSPEYFERARDAIPAAYNAANEPRQPNFMTVDFGLVRAPDGTLRPKLVELQAFPSLFGYQEHLARAYIDVYGLDGNLKIYLGGHTEESYWSLLRRTILGGHAPENVVLLELAPETQKTLPDFHVYEDRLGIATVDIRSVRKQGRRLFYQRPRESGGQGSGPWIPIERIFNRAIVDELEREAVALPFDYRDDLDVEWAGHPNWYFRISKFSLPFLRHPSVPKAVFLDDWFSGANRDALPAERDRLVLKPLYSFAGRGIRFAPTDAELDLIFTPDQPKYLMQERVYFDAIIDTPYGPTGVEVRILYLWPEEGELEAVISLVRMGRGLTMGVDQNREQQWVGASAALSR